MIYIGSREVSNTPIGFLTILELWTAANRLVPGIPGIEQFCSLFVSGKITLDPKLTVSEIIPYLRQVAKEQ
jgi:hypothetical protein